MSNLQKAHQHNQTQSPVKINKPEQKAKSLRVNPVQTLAAPDAAQHEDVLAAQQQVGNQVVQRAIDHNKRRTTVTDESGNLRGDLEKEIQQKRGNGSPLPDTIRKEVTGKFGRSFNDVRLHTDDKADKLSRSISARAFTIGSDIFFKSGVFDPGSSQGRETLIHELTHVVQQSGSKGGGGRLKLGAPDTAMEKEADKIGKRHAATKATSNLSAADGKAVQRKKVPAPAGDASENEADRIAHHVSGAGQPVGNAGLDGPGQVGAQAYAQGSDIHIGQGQDHHLPHEAWHVVQQRQGRVDPALQMQPGDEEEVQMQSEEEEETLQMQPDSGGVVQRIMSPSQWWDERKKKKMPEIPQAPPLPGVDLGLKAMGNAKNALGPGKKLKTTREKFGAGEQSLLQNEASRKKPNAAIAELEAKQQKKSDDSIKEQYKDPKRNIKNSREALMEKIKSSSTSTEDSKAAQEKLNTLHKRGKWETFKDKLTPGKDGRSYAEQAKEARKKSLKEAARGGDDEAYKSLTAEKAEKAKNSTGAKIKSTLGSLAGSLAGKIGGAVKEKATAQLTEYKDHYMGKSANKDEKPDTSSSSTKSSDGGGGVSGMIAELYQENKSLKEKIKAMEDKANSK